MYSFTVSLSITNTGSRLVASQKYSAEHSGSGTSLMNRKMSLDRSWVLADDGGKGK